MLGREALSHDHSGRGPPKIDSRVSLTAVSKSLAAWQMWLGGQVRRTKETFGRARHERRSVDSSWESPSSCRAPREVLTLVTLFWNTCSQKEGGPIGQPRREKPQRVTGMSDGSGDWVASACLC